MQVYLVAEDLRQLYEIPSEKCPLRLREILNEEINKMIKHGRSPFLLFFPLSFFERLMRLLRTKDEVTKMIKLLEQSELLGKTA